MYHHDDRPYDVAKSEAATYAKGKYEGMLEAGKAKAIALIERIHAESPRDRIVKGEALRFDQDEKGIIIDVGDGPQRLHKNARGQLAERTTLGGDFLTKHGESPEEWRREMVVHCLRQATGNIRGRYLSRSVKDDVRAMLSPKYRRIDGRPCVDAFADIAINQFGAVPIEAQGSDVRSQIVFALPHVFEPVKDEVMLFWNALQWSDYGKGKLVYKRGITRLWCTNKADMAEDYAQVHLGGELPDNVELSERTMQLDTERNVSLLQDVIGKSFLPETVEQTMAMIRTAADKDIDWKTAKTKLAKVLSKGELDAAGDLYEKDDSILLPTAKSTWRLSNTISLLAQRADDTDRRMDLEQLAGTIINGKYTIAQTADVA